MFQPKHIDLYILKINPLSVASFANIFSHSEGVTTKSGGIGRGGGRHKREGI